MRTLWFIIIGISISACFTINAKVPPHISPFAPFSGATTNDTTLVYSSIVQVPTYYFFPQSTSGNNQY